MVAIIRPLPEWRLNCGWRLKLELWVETVPRRLEETEDERTPDPRLVAAPPPRTLGTYLNLLMAARLSVKSVAFRHTGTIISCVIPS